MLINRITIFLICLVAGHIPATGQYGYNQLFEFGGSSGLNFDDILWDEDGIVVRGNIYVDSLNRWGLFVCKIDTAGEILWHSTFMDVFGNDDVISNTPTRFLKTSDDGFLLPVSYFFRGNIGLYKLDHNGVFEYAKEYLNFEKAMIPNSLVQVEGKYYISGIHQRHNFRIDMFVLKVDAEGNEAWIKHFGSETLDEYTAGLVVNKDASITLGGQIRPANFNDLPFEARWRQPWLLSIDTLGELTDEWKGEKNDDRAKSGSGVIKTKEGYLGMIYSEYKEIGPLTVYSKPTISLLDSNFNLLWKHEVGEFNSPANTFFDLEYDSLSNILLAVGQTGVDNRMQGCIFKFGIDGEEVWSLTTTNPDITGTSWHWLGGVCVSPSGSVYAAGYIDHAVNPSNGWILKVTPDGCVDTLCTTTSIMEQIKVKENIVVYPNPAVEEIVIEIKTPIHEDLTIRMFNATGMPLIQQKVQSGPNTIALQGLNTGIIFYSIFTNQGQLLKGGSFLKVE